MLGHRHTWEEYIYLKKIGCLVVDSSHPVEGRFQWRILVNKLSGSVKGVEFLTS
jgi:hypothetical protein